MEERKNSLNKIIEYAYSNVEHYHDLFDRLCIKPEDIKEECDLTKLPPLKKDEIQRDFSGFISKEYQKYPKNQQVDLRRTSGSTGKCLKIYWGQKDNIRSLMSLWKIRKDLYGIDPKMKFCNFFSVRYSGNKIIPHLQKELGADGRCLSFSKIGLTKERLKEYYNEILEFNPDWLSLQPSIAFLLAQTVLENHFKAPSNLKYIELTGEILTAEQRKIIHEAFGLRPTNMYGMNECNTIAIECRQNSFHVLSSNVILEVLNQDGVPVIGEEGDIYVTCLTNYAMPFIRYETGDRGALFLDTCSCGKKSYLLKLASGRTSDLIHLPDNKTLNPYVIYSAIEYTNEFMNSAISQYQIRQTNFNKFSVLLVLKPAYKSWSNAISDFFLNNIEDPALKDAEWDIDFVDAIYPDESTGKVKSFVKMEV